MRYIKTFENLNEFDVKEFFKGKINWKIFDYIKDITTEYTDRDHYVSIYILYGYDKGIDGTPRLTGFQNIYRYLANSTQQKDKEGYIELNTKNIERIRRIDQNSEDNTPEIAYLLTLRDYDSTSEIDGDEEVLNKILSSILNKFKDSFVFELETLWPNEIGVAHKV